MLMSIVLLLAIVSHHRAHVDRGLGFPSRWSHTRVLRSRSRLRRSSTG